MESQHIFRIIESSKKNDEERCVSYSKKLFNALTIEQQGMSETDFEKSVRSYFHNDSTNWVVNDDSIIYKEDKDYSYNGMNISLIAAVNRNNGLGYKNQLLYHIKDDIKRFRKLTLHHVVVMGYNTYKSLPNGALKDRTNVVLSTSVSELPDATVYNSLETFLSDFENYCGEIFVIGGASLYKQMLPYANKIYLTEIQDSEKEADVFFPEIPDSFDVEFAECHEDDNYKYCFTDYKRIKDF